MSAYDRISSYLTHLSQHFESTPSAKRDLEPFVKDLEQQALSLPQIEQAVNSIAKCASLYNEEQDSKFIGALVSIEKNQKGDYVYKYPLVVACLLNHYPISFFGPSPEKEYFFWQKVSSSWEDIHLDTLMGLYQLRQTGILKSSSAKVQKKFYEEFLTKGGESIPFAKLSREETRAMLEEIWNDESLRSTFLSDPYLVLRCLPYTSLLSPGRAQELKGKWEWFVKTKELEYDGQISHSWDEIDFSHYSSSALWRDGIPDLPLLTLQELRRLPRVMRILHLAAPASRSCFTHPTQDFADNIELLFFIIALSHPSLYERVGKLLDPDILCCELEKKLEMDFSFLPVSKKKGYLPTLWKVALTWCVECCVPYDKAESREEKERIKKTALHQIETNPEEGIVLWWVSQVIPPSSLCTQLFDKGLRNSSAFTLFLYKEVFGEMVARERSFDGWRLFVALCLNFEQRTASFTNFENTPPSLSADEGALVLILAQLWRSKKLSPLIPVEFPSFLRNKGTTTYELYTRVLRNNRNNADWKQLDALSGGATPLLLKMLFRIDELFEWRKEQPFLPLTEFPMIQMIDTQMILHLRKIASEPRRANFQIVVFAPDEKKVEFSPLCCFSTLPSNLFSAILQFVPLSDHANWSLVSKACSHVRKSQEYWYMRCVADLNISKKEENKNWSEVYQEGYYLNRWIPQQFQRAIGSDRPTTYVTMAYPALALNEEQLKKVWSEAEIAAFDDTRALLPFKWLRSLKMNQEELLKFFDHALFGEQANDGSCTPSVPWLCTLKVVSALAVEERSVGEILKKISNASLLSRTTWDRWSQERFSENKKEIEEGLSLCFGKQFIEEQYKKHSPQPPSPHDEPKGET